jgi:hypothetical protein
MKAVQLWPYGLPHGTNLNRVGGGTPPQSN